MPLLLILIFPLAEIAAFIAVGRVIGILPTLILIVASSAIGMTMLRDAGAGTLSRLQQGRGAPAAILAEGGTRMLAGILLLIPGFLTDLAALIVLIPSARRLFGGGMKMTVDVRVKPSAQPQEPSGIIEGDFRRLDR
jgi:UPF0716 protein FxsA